MTYIERIQFGACSDMLLVFSRPGFLQSQAYHPSLDDLNPVLSLWGILNVSRNLPKSQFLHLQNDGETVVATILTRSPGQSCPHRGNSVEEGSHGPPVLLVTSKTVKSPLPKHTYWPVSLLGSF